MRPNKKRNSTIFRQNDRSSSHKRTVDLRKAVKKSFLIEQETSSTRMKHCRTSKVCIC